MSVEQTSKTLLFLGFYTASGSGATGLTVTVDVRKTTVTGTTTTLVTGGSATEIGGGLYYYSLSSGSNDAKALYTAVFKTAGVADQKHIPALWVAGLDWVQNVDGAVTSRLASASYTSPPSAASISTQVAADLASAHGSGSWTTATGFPTSAQIADKILGRNLAGGSDGGRTVTDALRFLRNRWTRTPTTLTVYAEDDTTTAWSSVLTVSANANPVTESDPG